MGKRDAKPGEMVFDSNQAPGDQWAAEIRIDDQIVGRITRHFEWDGERVYRVLNAKGTEVGRNNKVAPAKEIARKKLTRA
jgi:hypothetical protein